MFARIGRLVRGFLRAVHQRHRGSESRSADGSGASGFPPEDDAVQPGARQDGRRRRAAEGPGEGEGRARAGSRAPHPRQPSAGNLELAGTLARELQELKADLTDRHAGAAGDRGGLSGQPAPGEGRAAGVPGQGPQAREAAVAGADQGSAGRSGDGAVERRLQGRRSRRHDEDRRRHPAEALRSVGRQGARRQGHGRHRRRSRRRRTSARRSSRQALAEFLASQGIQATPPRPTTRRRPIKEMGPNQ